MGCEPCLAPAEAIPPEVTTDQFPSRLRLIATAEKGEGDDAASLYVRNFRTYDNGILSVIDDDSKEGYFRQQHPSSTQRNVLPYPFVQNSGQ